MTTIDKTTSKIIQEVAQLITSGIECWQKAGETVVTLMDDHGLNAAEIAQSSPYLTETLVIRFEQLGRKQLLPDLLVAEYPAARHIIRLPYSEQKRAVSEPLELLVVEGGETTTLKVSAENMTPQQCKQVFGNQIRGLSAQRAYLEDKKSSIEATGVVRQLHDVYRVRGKKVLILQPCELSARQLANLIAEIEN
jgi:hypothetical protein